MVENVGVRGTAKTYSVIVHRAQKFGIPIENVKSHVFAMLEAQVIHTVKQGRDGSNLNFFGTPFLKSARINKRKRTEEENDDKEEKDGNEHEIDDDTEKVRFFADDRIMKKAKKSQ